MSKMSLEDSDTEGACACNFKKSSSDNIFHKRSTYLELPSRVYFKFDSSSSESDLDVRKAYRRLPVPTTPSDKTLYSESSQSKSDIEDDYFPPYEHRESVCKTNSMHMELYSTPPAQVAIVINHSVSERIETLKADKYEDVICQVPCVQWKYNRSILQDTNKMQSTSQEKPLTAISEIYDTENTDKVNSFNSDPKEVMGHSQLELKRLQIKKVLKQIELLDVMLTREKERSIRDNYRFEKEMLLLKTEITKTLNKSVITNSTNTSQ